MDNRLAYIDQASFLGLRALGHAPLPQLTWIYDHAIDLHGLRRFHRRLGDGLLGRRIERSPLPFARHRWVACGGRDLDVETAPRRRADVAAWADHRARVPLDPERGPGWHLATVPLDDGGAAVSLVVSHTIADGLGICLAVADAVRGDGCAPVYPPPRSRPRRALLREDLRLTVRELPVIARAGAAAMRLGRGQRDDLAASVSAAPRPRRAGGPVDVPAVTAWVRLDDWDRRAKQLGGTSNSLFAGVAAQLGLRLGRRRDDGTVALSFPVSERVDGDTRGNALTSAVVAVDPAGAAADLAPIRTAVKRELTALAARPNDLLAPLPLTPLVPRALARRLSGMALGNAAAPIGCSNLGELDPEVNRPDGTDADAMSVRLVEPGIGRSELERMGGQLFLASGRVGGSVFLSVVGYRAGARNTTDALREQLSDTLAEFDLDAYRM